MWSGAEESRRRGWGQNCERFSVPFCTQLGNGWIQRIETVKSGFSKENESGRLVDELEHEETS